MHVEIPTWKELCTLEPQLIELERLTHKTSEKYRRHGYGPWYKEIRPRLTKLIGSGRPIPGYTPPEIPPGVKFICIADLYTPAEKAKLKAAQESIPENLKVLYGSPAYDVVYRRLLDVLMGEYAATEED